MDRNTCRAKDFTVCLRKIPPVYSSTQDLAKKLKRHFEKVLSDCKPCFLPGAVKVTDINFTSESYKVLQPAIHRGQVNIFHSLISNYTSYHSFIHSFHLM